LVAVPSDQVNLTAAPRPVMEEMPNQPTDNSGLAIILVKKLPDFHKRE
jgi:hypothetical protein